MRCDCCNNILSDREATRKFKESGEYTNTCTNCLSYISDVPTRDSRNLREDDEDLDEDLIDYLENEDDEDHPY